MSNLHAEGFTKNPKIPLISKVIAVGLPFGVAIGYFVAGNSLVRRPDCQSGIRELAYLLVACIAIQSIYFWLVNHRKCQTALQSLIDRGSLRFEPNGKKVRIFLDDRRIGDVPKYWKVGLWFCIVLLVGIFFTGNLFMGRACTNQAIGHPGLGVLLAFYAFVTVAANHMALVLSSTPFNFDDPR